MNLTEMQAAVDEAKGQLARADIIATILARLLVGRLRKVESGYVLADLKRELRAFNIQTKTWSDK